ncbi:TonB-dependent receptor domain-containing protein [Chitinophaga filiformis]|uniref:Outer membrane receptor proteins, mostly Fe transport n=1 Tax=Chitinophaga filiformis TaxID=104663 RepID=A0A1G7ZFL1_CHIFI|nr:TonB-dependent receptor [Chitinophaga filiformis]SDH07488.1 Outer membrane receptor proteins, mostly Fe transport [Chitinophaga filiformis]
MKKLSFLLCCILLLKTASGQISGRFATAAGQPVPFANVILLNGTDTTLIKAVLTDEKGVYSIENTPSGKYILRFSSMGFQTWNSPLFELTAQQKKQDFGLQVVHEGAQQLGEVVVQAEKPLLQQQPEGMVVNVQSSLLTKGSTALAVLERSPGVVIDYRNNSIALNGKSGVTLMLNGKLMRVPLEQLVNLLNGMSADDIEKIELLSTPSSKYDADGSAGMINIVLKKNKQQGTNGTLSVTGGYGYREKAAASISLSHNTAKINSYGSYSYNLNRSYSYMDILSYQDMPVFGGRMEVRGADITRLRQNNHDITLGLDMKPNTKTTIGANVTYNISRAGTANHPTANYLLLPDSLLTFDGRIDRVNSWYNLVSSVYLEKEINPKSKINFDMDYLYFKNYNPSQIYSSLLTRNGEQVDNNDSLFSPFQRGFANTLIQMGVIKVDYSRQLNDKIKLEAGIKGTYTGSNTLSRIESLVDGHWVSRTETINEMKMKEGIGAAYVSANIGITSSLSLTAGTRFEYARTIMEDTRTGKNTVDRKLATLFPNIFLTKKLNERSSLQLSYTKRIARPSYNDLASFMAYSDPTAIYAGNPLLKPTITNNIKLGYNYDGVSFSLLFSRDDHPIARYQLSQSTAANVLYISPQNLAYQNNITIQATIPWKATDWWDMSYSITGGLRQFRADYTLQPVTKNYFAYTFNFTESFKLPHDFSAELTGWYNTRFYNGTVKVGRMGTVSAGIKKELKNNAGSIQLSVADVFTTMNFSVHYGTIAEEAFQIKNDIKIYQESSYSPIFRLSYSRPFGTGTLKASRKEGGAKDERDRIRKD